MSDVRVRLKCHYPPWNSGEMVFVPVETAKFMVRQEIAELVNEPKEDVSKPKGRPAVKKTAKKAAAKKAPKKRR